MRRTSGGKRDAHHFANHGNPRASYSEVCNRIDGDNGFYPDDGLMRGEDESRPFAAHKDGRRY